MAALSKYKKLLIMLGLLLLAKFIWVPVWEHKQNQWAQLSQGQHNLNKTQALIALSEQMKQREEEISWQLASIENLIPETENLASYKLASQNTIESLFQKHNLILDRTAWRDGVNQQNIHKLFFDLHFNGKLKNYLSLTHNLATASALFNISIFEENLNITGQESGTLGQVSGNVSLQLSVKVLPNGQSSKELE
jgi:hypothetical protein